MNNAFLRRRRTRAWQGEDVVFTQNQRRHRVGQARKLSHVKFQLNRATLIFGAAGENWAWLGDDVISAKNQHRHRTRSRSCARSSRLRERLPCLCTRSLRSVFASRLRERLSCLFTHASRFFTACVWRVCARVRFVCVREHCVWFSRREALLCSVHKRWERLLRTVICFLMSILSYAIRVPSTI